MITNIFINLPVKDLDKSKAFFEAIGGKVNAQFTDETASSIVLGGNIFAMLLTHAKFKEFTTKQIVDTRTSQEVIIALGAGSKDEVNRIVEAAVKAGGKEFKPTQDYGFMYMRVFEDLDGHHWEVAYMDPSFVQPY
jgi:predicted lactoylglutathione lyase